MSMSQPGYAAVLAAFPRRSLTLKAGRGAIGGFVLALLGTLLFGAFLAMLAIDVLPALREDFAIRDQAVPTALARVTEGRCTSRLALFQSCDVKISLRGKNGTLTRDISYLFVEPHIGSWSATPMIDPARPELVTTDIGLDRLWNRVATLIGAALLGVALIVGLVIAAFRGRAGSGQVKALSGRTLEPVPVEFFGWGEGPTWQVRDEHGAVFTWPVKKSHKPFLLDPQRGLVLALREPGGGPAFPLDEKLRFAALTPPERAAVLAAGAAAAPRPVPA